ncbi:TonB-dependent receptor [Prevotella sp. oral taxon 376]|uniref:SusC/RagA family TonB-linked outer membrane protein n=1 Tax=Prevotella sp. oral taxon 376 TaxID=712466 RepID=UPI001E2EBEDD|nr:TonB-dependent receptor [Prevotella sp. oral taxon 376]
MGKRLTMILASLFLLVGTALAQTSVRGTVTSAEDGEPVVGASIKVVGTNTGTVTDLDGHFSLTVPNSNSRLEISYIGMKSQTVKVSDNMRVVLQPDNQTLDEVMVVAFGRQTKESFAGSAAVMNSTELGKKITTNVADALVGSVPGLQLTGGSGQPGASQGDIHIRGIASLYASTAPLIVVDGAPYTASLSNIPQDDIESVTVLKDASSAALYGARGAAGVILITTKKGGGQKAHINLEAKWGATSRSVQDYDTFSDPGQFMEAYYSQFFNYAFYRQGMTREQANAWVNQRIISDQSIGLQYNPFTVPAGENLIGLDGKLNPKATLGRSYKYGDETYYIMPDNWKDAAYRHGTRHEYTVNVSGGNTKMSYYSSVGYLKEKGVLENSGFERFTARLKADYEATDWLHLYSNVGYVHSMMESNPNLSNTTTNAANMGYFTQYIAPIYPLYVRVLDADGKPVIRTDKYGHEQYDFGVPSTGYPGQGSRPFLATGNPIGSNRYNEVTSGGDQIQGQFSFDLTFTPWLKFNSTNSFNFGLSRYSHYENPYIGNAAAENGTIDKYNNTSFRQNYVQTLNFHKQFGQHDVQVMLGHEWYKQRVNFLEALARGGFSPEIKELNAFSDRYDAHSYNTTYNVEGYFGNVLYNYAQRYFAQASYRRDASSRFAKDHRWGDFWSVGGAWIISKENFFKSLNADWVDNLKLKVSVGQQGNDGIPDFYFLERYSLSKGNLAMLPSFAAIGNPDITWETTTNFNVGLEFSFLKNRVNGEVNFYNKKTTDMLFQLNIPESMGVRGYYDNVGDIRNRGVELTLSGDIIRTKDITWSVTGNISHNSAKALKLDKNKIEQYGGFSQTDARAGFNIPMWYAEGQPLYNGMMPDYAGVNEQGEPLYWVDEDIYKDYQAGKMSNSSKPGTKHSFTTTNWSEASYYTHSMLPKASGGFSTTLRAYGFDASATFDYQFGGKIYDFGYAVLMRPVSDRAGGSNYSTDVLKAWTPDNTSSNIPRFMYTDQNTTSQSTRFLTNAKYLNFQSFVVGYTLPVSLTSKLMLSKVRVYVQGENLCFWSARKGLDPRYSFQGTQSSGINSYAPVRTVMGGIQLSF